jgi:hypothetical protein
MMLIFGIQSIDKLLWTPRKIREDIGKEESAILEKRANDGT